MKKAIFIDKDGTLIPNIPYNVNPDLITIEDTAIAALKRLQEAGYLLIVISNQSGVARGYFTEEDLHLVSNRLSEILKTEDITINGFYYCPHFKTGIIKQYAIDCDCRKPKPGLILRAVKDFIIDASQSWMLGDTLTDMEAGKAAGCQTILLQHNVQALINTKEYQADHIVTNFAEAADIIIDSQLIH